MTDRTIDWVFRATDKTSAAFRAVDSRISRLSKGLKSFAGFAGFAVLASSVGSFAKELLDLGSELNDTSERLNISAESLQGFKLGAEEAGASFDQFTKAVVFLTKLTSSAAFGSSGAIQVFRRLGIEVEGFAKLSADRRLLVLAEAIKKGDATGKSLELTLLALGRGSAELSTLFAKGADGLIKYQQEAEKVGVITTEQAQILDQAQEQWAKYWTAIKVGSVPALTAFINFTEGAKNALSSIGDTLNQSLLFNFFTLYSRAIKQASSGTPQNQLKPRAKRTSSLTPLEEQEKNLLTIPVDKSTIDAEKKLIRDLAKQAEAARKDQLSNQQKTNAEKLSNQQKANARFLEEEKRNAENITEINDRILAMTKEANAAFTDRISELKEQYKPALNILVEGIKEVNGLIGLGLDFQTANARIQELGDNYSVTIEEMKGDTEGLQDSTISLLQSIEVAANGFARDLTDVFFDATQSIGDLFKNLAITIAKALFTQNITEPLINSILGSLKFGSASTAPPRAMGGPVGAGGTFLVGERGPELFVPNTGGTIIPNNAQQPVGVYLTITSVDPQTAAQTIANQERLITAMIRRASVRAGVRPVLA